MEVISESDRKPSSAPDQNDETQDVGELPQKCLFRRSTGSKRNRRKTRMSSSSSLHSLVSILKPTDADQRSVPNVSFGEEKSDDYKNDGVSKSSLNVNPSIGEASAHFYAMEVGESSYRLPGGSFSTQNSTIGFRSSFFSVLEKLGVWRSQDLYKATTSVSETKFPPDRKTGRSSVTSLYFRAIYGGKYEKKIFHDIFKTKQTNSIFNNTCCKAQCQSTL